jgi:superfamily II DNA or RNA helicase
MSGNVAPFERLTTKVSPKTERRKSRKRKSTPEQEARMALLRERWKAMEDRALGETSARLDAMPVQLKEPPASRKPTSGLTLRPYQEATVAAAIEPKPNVWRRLVVMATGGGKTLVFSEIINRVLKPGRRALVLAHRDELLMQAKAEIEGYVPGVCVEVERAEHRASRSESLLDRRHRHVVVGSVASMRGNRLKTWDRSTFDLVIIDEAHHGAAQSYRDIVDHFGCMCDDRRIPLIGVTATPQRSDKVGLGVLFQEIAASYPLPTLIKQRYLCNIRAIAIDSDTDLRRVRVRAGDFAQGELEEAVNTDKRNLLILAAHQRFASDRPTIVFASGVAHAMRLAAMFSTAGVPAEAIYGAMDEDDRRAALSRYACGETRVLTNYAVLGEGFNSPHTSAIILARPTQSSLVITQAIGRGSRLYPGKEDELIIDILDITAGKDLFSAASLAGLPANFDAQGKDLFKTAQRLDELKKLDPASAWQALDAATVEKSIERAMERIRAREIEILRREEQRKEQEAAWKAQRAEREARQAEMDAKIAALNARNAARPYESPFMWYVVGDGIEISPNGGETTYAVVPSSDANAYVVTVRMQGEAHRVIGSYNDMNAATRAADADITDRYHNTTLIRKTARWTSEPATEKQLTLLARFGVPINPNMTKGEACQRLNVLFARKQYGVPCAA